MTLHHGPRSRVLARSMQFMAGGFGIGLLGGLFITEAAAPIAAPVGMIMLVLFVFVVGIQVALMGV